MMVVMVDGGTSIGDDRLFVLQLVIVVENRWFSNGRGEPPTRTERQYRINDMLFAARDEETAFKMAEEWLANDAFSDCNHDGPGDLTRIFALGIHELSEIAGASEVVFKARELYGVALPGFWLGDIGADGIPIVRPKDDLEVFRILRMRSRPPTS